MGTSIIERAAAQPHDPKTLDLDKLAVDAVAAFRGVLFVAAVMVAVDIEKGSTAHGDEKAQIFGFQVSRRKDQVDPIKLAWPIIIPKVRTLFVGNQEQLHVDPFL